MFYKVKAVFLQDRILEKAFVEVVEGRFRSITTKAPKSYRDCSHALMAPGFFDTHIHGYGGHDIMDLDPEGFLSITEGILENGVTAFLPTTLTASTETLNRACRMIGDYADRSRGAKVMGIFLEGPFFTEKYKGAQNPKYFCDPSLEKLRHWNELSGGRVKKVALAPERAGSLEFIEGAKAMGIHVALGHSDACYEEAMEAVRAGAGIFVHSYNAMSGLHHRAPGMVGTLLSTRDTYGELIADGHHVHPGAVRVLLQAKGHEHVPLVTDCMMAGGLPEGEYRLGEFQVHVKDGTARLDSGALAGSVLKLQDGVKNLTTWDVASLFEAIQMASRIPAESLGLGDRIGVIEEGREADFVLLDENIDVVSTFVRGEEKYRRP